MRLSGVFLALLWAPALFGTDPRNDRFRAIQIPPVANPSLVKLDFDKDIFRHSPSGYGDIRVRDSKGVVQSHVEMRPTQTLSESRKTIFSGKTLSAMPIDGGGFQVEVGIEENTPRPTGLRINTPLSDFENRVTIYGLKKEGGETKLAEGLLVDYRSLVDYRVDSINFDAGAFKKFRIVVAKPTVQQESAILELSRKAGAPNAERLNILRRPFRIEGIDFFTTTEVVLHEQPLREEVAPESFATFVDDPTKITIVEFETSGAPFGGVEFFPKTTNFRRKARLEYGTMIPGSKTGSPQKESQMNWTIASQGTLSSLDFQGHKSRNTRLECPESRQTKWRLVIENGDSPAVEVESVKIVTGKIQLVFLALPGESYQLEYGDHQANPASFDTAAIQAMLQKKVQPLIGQLGEVRLRELPAVEKPAESWLQWLMHQKGLFGIVVLALAVILGFTLYQTAKRVNAESEPPPAG